MAQQSARRDRLLAGGWLAILLSGQLLVPVTVPALEAFAAAWLFAGVLLVRRTFCLPWLLLSAPAFFCPVDRSWAWVQIVMLGLMVVRIVATQSLSRRVWLQVAAAVLLVTALGWPQQAGALVREWARITDPGRIEQFVFAKGTWAAYPFRVLADRALWAVALVLLWRVPGWFSSRRTLNALYLAGLTALVAAYGAVVLPWHEHHRFLGTSNFGVYESFPLHGAGYNAFYLPALALPALAAATMPLGRLRWAHLGTLLLWVPAIFGGERIAIVGLLGALAGCVALVARGAFFRAGRVAMCRRWRLHTRRAAVPCLIALVASAGIVGWWAVHILHSDQADVLRQRFGGAGLASLKKDVAYGSAATNLLAAADTPPRDIFERTERFLAPYDQARAHLWSLGLRTTWHHHLVIGHGAGTFGRFHKTQPRPSELSFVNMHNSWLDLAFEYGALACVLFLAAIAFGLLRMAAQPLVRPAIPLILAALAAGMGHNLFFATAMLFMMTAVILIPMRALVRR